MCSMLTPKEKATIYKLSKELERVIFPSVRGHTMIEMMCAMSLVVFRLIEQNSSGTNRLILFNTYLRFVRETGNTILLQFMQGDKNG